MQNHLRSYSFLVLVALLGVSYAQDECGLRGVPASTSGANAVWLEINDVFVFYLSPVPPHLIGDSLVLPAEPAAHLIGLEYHFDEAAREATLSLRGQELVMQDGATVARAGGATVPLAVPARLLDGGQDLLIPLRSLIDAFDLRSSWDDSKRVLSIQSETALTEPDISRVFLREVPNGSQRLGVAPRSFSLAPGGPVAGGCPLLRFEVTVDPVGSSGVEPALYVMFRHPESLSIAGPLVHVSDDPANTSEEACSLRKGQLACGVDVQWNALRYILAVFVAP